MIEIVGGVLEKGGDKRTLPVKNAVDTGSDGNYEEIVFDGEYDDDIDESKDLELDTNGDATFDTSVGISSVSYSSANDETTVTVSTSVPSDPSGNEARYTSPLETFAGISEFSLDEEFDYGEIRNANNPGYGRRVDGNDSWSATLSIDLYAKESGGSASLEDSVGDLRRRARNRGEVNVVITYGGEQDFGDLEFSAVTEEAKCVVTSISTEGSFIQDGEVWTADIEVDGIEQFSQI